MTQHTIDPWAAHNFSHPHSALGVMTWLMQHADYHRRWDLHAVNIDIVPAIMLGQYRIYHASDGTPIGFVTWAYVNDEVKDILIKRRRPMTQADWRSGNLLMFNDCVAPFGMVREMVSELRKHFSKDHAQAFSLRRGRLGEIHKINRWLATPKKSNTQRSDNSTSLQRHLLRETSPKARDIVQTAAARDFL